METQSGPLQIGDFARFSDNTGFLAIGKVTSIGWDKVVSVQVLVDLDSLLQLLDCTDQPAPRSRTMAHGGRQLWWVVGGKEELKLSRFQETIDVCMEALIGPFKPETSYIASGAAEPLCPIHNQF